MPRVRLGTTRQSWRESVVAGTKEPSCRPGAPTPPSWWQDPGPVTLRNVDRDPRPGEPVTVEQAVRIAKPPEWTPQRGPGEIVCWGVLRSGLLRHPVFVGWQPSAGLP